MMRFSLDAKLNYVWIIMAIAAYFEYEIWQMDVKTALLNGNLKEGVYMIQLEVLSIQRMPDRCESFKGQSMV